MLRTILLPVDFDEELALTLRLAQGLPALGTRRVVLAHVVEASGMEGPVIAHTVDDMRERMRALTAPLEAAGLKVEVRIPAGDPFEQIMALAAEEHVDGLVAGSHAKSIVEQLIAGSVSERIVRDAAVLDLIARYDLMRNEDDPADLLRRFGERVLLPTDFSLSASHAFTAALGFPRGAVKMLYLLHAIDPALSGEKLRRAEEGADFQLKNLQAMARQVGVPATVVLAHGEAQHVVLAEMQERRITGVITGTRGNNAIQEALLGSVSMTVLKQASCPVMIVP